MTEIAAYLIVQILTQMYPLTVSHLVALKTFLTTHNNSIATQLSAEQITAQMAVVKISINQFMSLCRIDLFVGLTSQQNGQQMVSNCDFGLSFTPSLGNITTFTMTLPSKPKASLLNFIHSSYTQ
jgi:hypothetical protein